MYQELKDILKEIEDIIKEKKKRVTKYDYPSHKYMEIEEELGIWLDY